MAEHWCAWRPLPNLSPLYAIDRLIDGVDHLELLLSSWDEQGPTVRIFFDTRVLAYRSCDETFRSMLFARPPTMNESDSFATSSLFCIKESSYIKWLFASTIEQVAHNYTHFCIIGGNCVVDIVSHTMPSVELLKTQGEHKHE